MISLFIFSSGKNETQEMKLSGEIMECTLNYFVFQSVNGEKYLVDIYDDFDYSIGDKVTVYYNGNILEVSPARFKHIIRVERRKK